MINRRRFLHALVVASATPAASSLRTRTGSDFRFGNLVADSRAILDLPPGFSYEILSRQGDEMDDGLLAGSRRGGRHCGIRRIGTELSSGWHNDASFMNGTTIQRSRARAINRS